MITITLSDFTADRANEAERRRRTAHQAALGAAMRAHNAACMQYWKEIQASQEQADALREATVSAFRKRRFLSCARNAMRQFAHSFSPLPQRPASPAIPAMPPPSDAERRWRMGGEGERYVRERLAAILTDEWTCLAGYCNHKGEIDAILVGPKGIVFALEVKYLRGTIHCGGDRWSQDRYNRQGNLCEADRIIEDGGGRSPSQQVNEAADALAHFLSSRTPLRRVQRAVVLSHPDSRIGRYADVPVDFLFHIRDITAEHFDRYARERQSPARPAELVRLVQKHHASYEQHRNRERRQLEQAMAGHR
jgi:hypothetical protein